MKKALMPALLVLSVAIAGCGGVKEATTPVADPQTPVTTPAPPVTTPPQTGSDTPAPAPTPAPTPTPEKPTVKWRTNGIGYPLVSDDPEAKGKKVVLLTFDDGPSDTGSTASILDTLKANDVKAMFFVTGYGARNRDLLERIHKEGHVIGPHTMTHPNLATLTVDEMRKEIEPLNKIIEEVTGEKPKYLRPPFGAYNDALIELVKEYDMEILNWTNGSLDWEGTKDGYKDPNQVVADVMSQLHPGAVVLFHDTLKHTAEALPEVIKQIKAEGYEFIVLH